MADHSFPIQATRFQSDRHAGYSQRDVIFPLAHAVAIRRRSSAKRSLGFVPSSPRLLDLHERGDAFAVRRKIKVPDRTGNSPEPPLGPDPRLFIRRGAGLLAQSPT
jgi:hypothetical protein